MHEKVLPRHSVELLTAPQNDAPALKEWVLAGGTGLALQLGHRVSEDLDLFRTDDLDVRCLHDVLGRQGSYETLQEADHTLTCFEDAEGEPMPRMLEPFDWNECKAFFVREARAIVLR